jgi:hypothetical protein
MILGLIAAKRVSSARITQAFRRIMDLKRNKLAMGAT